MKRLSNLSVRMRVATGLLTICAGMLVPASLAAQGAAGVGPVCARAAVLRWRSSFKTMAPGPFFASFPAPLRQLY